MDGGHIIDYANIGGMIWQTNLIESMTNSDRAGRDSQGSQFWDMRRLGGGSQINEPTQGTWYQLLVSMGYTTISSAVWRNYSARSLSSQDTALAIDAFRRFATGLPLSSFRGRYNPIDPTGLIAEAPFTPARRLEINRSYAVNDPLIHGTMADVSPPLGASALVVYPGGIGASPFGRLAGIGRINRRYTPWLWGDYPFTSDEAFRDPMVTSTDAWQFASGLALNHRWFDRIHRGTPWQTIYYGGGQASQSVQWSDYSHPLMLPQNDWRWIEEFRKDWLGLPVVEDAAPEPIIVNNTIANNSAGNSATGSAIHFEPGAAAQVVNNIVAFNAAGLEQLVAGSPFLLANCIFGNPNGDYLGLAPGLRDFRVDPQLRDPAHGDFTLSTTSSLIDAAHPLPWLAGWLTADEPARWQNRHFDLGAAELPINVAPWLSIGLESGSAAPTLTLFGFPGLRYRLEVSEDFATWSPLADVFTPGGLVEVSLEPASERIFIRARKLTN